MARVYLSFLPLLFFHSLFAQKGRFTLQVKTDDAPGIHGFSYWQEIKVVSKDTSFLYPLHSSKPDQIKNLKPGEYDLKIYSLFNHHVSKKIKLHEKTPVISFTGLQSFYNKMTGTALLSNKIKTGDTLFILFNSTAGGSSKEKVAVTKTKTGYTAIQYKGITSVVFQDMQVGEREYKSVIKLETEGRKANSTKAETAPVAEVFTMELNKEIVSFIVPGAWHGMDTLKASLFMVEKK